MTPTFVHRGRSLDVVDIRGKVDGKTAVSVRVTANGDR
jgi:hypothetical protein